MEIRSNNIKEGEWFCSPEGIAFAEKIYDFYYEEYEDIPHNKKVGDYFQSIVQYKLFCDFDGKPITRNRLKIFDVSWCSPIDSRYKDVLNNSVRNNSKKYESFCKFLKQNKRVNDSIIFFCNLLPKDCFQAEKELEYIRKMLPGSFTFYDFEKLLNSSSSVLRVENFVRETFGLETYVRISLDYTVGSFKDKRVIFNDFNFVIM